MKKATKFNKNVNLVQICKVSCLFIDHVLSISDSALFAVHHLLYRALVVLITKKEFIMTTNLPVRAEEANQRWIVGIIDGKIEMIQRIKFYSLVLAFEELAHLMLKKEMVGDELAEQIRTALDKRDE